MTRKEVEATYIDREGLTFIPRTTFKIVPGQADFDFTIIVSAEEVYQEYLANKNKIPIQPYDVLFSGIINTGGIMLPTNVTEYNTLIITINPNAESTLEVKSLHYPDTFMLDEKYMVNTPVGATILMIDAPDLLVFSEHCRANVTMIRGVRP